MILRSNDNIFNAYNNKYIYVEVNGEIKKYFCIRTNPGTSFDNTELLSSLYDDFEILSETDDETCN